MGSTPVETSSVLALDRVIETIQNELPAMLVANAPTGITLVAPVNVHLVDSEAQCEQFPTQGDCVAFVYKIGPSVRIYAATGGATHRTERRRFTAGITLYYSEDIGSGGTEHPISRESRKGYLYASIVQSCFEKFLRDDSYIQDVQFLNDIPKQTNGIGRELSRGVKLQFDIYQRVLIPMPYG